jgi:site-specific recombinase XerD
MSSKPLVSRIGPAVDPAVSSFELIRQWQAFLDAAGRTGASTRRQYRRCLTNFLAEVLKGLTEVTEDDVIVYVTNLAHQGPTRGMTIRALRSFYSWAENHKVCENPVRLLKEPRQKYGPVVYLTDDEIDHVLEAADEVDPRARWALQLMYATGARVSSLVAVTPDDIRGDLIYFRFAKGNRPYAVPLGAKGREAVDHLMELRDWKPPTAKSRLPTLVGVGKGMVWRWTREAGRKVGVGVHPHLLRHTFGTKLARDPAVSQIDWVTLMNHVNGSLLRRYSVASDESLRSAVEKL